MGTVAQRSFEDNWATIGHLLSVGSGHPRTHEQIAAVNQASLVFCITAWEAYVEDVAREAAEYLARNCPSFDRLPKTVRKALVAEVTPRNGVDSATPSGKRPQHLADDGWRSLLPTFVTRATEGGSFNTPNTTNTRTLFTKWCGLDVTESWSWQRFMAPKAAERLDESISIRGEIIHTGQKPDGINRNWIDTYGERNIRQLVKKTDEALVAHVNTVCGTADAGADAFGADTP